MTDTQSGLQGERCPDCGSHVVMRDDAKSGNPRVRYGCDVPSRACEIIESLRAETILLREALKGTKNG